MPVLRPFSRRLQKSHARLSWKRSLFLLAVLLCFYYLSRPKFTPSLRPAGCRCLLDPNFQYECATARAVVVFDGAKLLPDADGLFSRIEFETAYERFRRVFPRSAAEARFKHKTRRSSVQLAMNAGFVFQDIISGRFSHTTPALTTATRILLCFRAALSEWGPGDLYAATLTSSWQTTGVVKQLSASRRVGGRWYGPPWREDPRLFPFRGGLGMSYTVTSAYERNRHGFNVWQRQSFALLDQSFEFEAIDIFLSIGNNSNFATTTYPSFEKNWGFFEDTNGSLLVLYSVQPFVLHRVEQLVFHSLVQSTAWHSSEAHIYGTLRGGAPPVLVNDTWFTFVHSSSYDLFVITFANTPAYDLVACSRAPVVDFGGDAFVTGALFVADMRTWFLSLTAPNEETQVAVISLLHDTVLASLTPVHLELPISD